jgi:hypothetical protein
MNFVDIEGEVFGRLTVTGPFERKNNKTFWLCKCECGKEKWVQGANLKNGNTKSCGCYYTEYKINRKIKYDITGTKNNNFLVLREFEKNSNPKDKAIYYWCKCDCGEECKRSRREALNKNNKYCKYCRPPFEKMSGGKKSRMGPRKNLTGFKNGLLTYTDKWRNTNDGSEIEWLANCECGNEKWVKTFTSKTQKSCDCIRRKKGKDHHQYNVNLSKEDRLISKNRALFPGMVEWRQECLLRDGFVCVICGTKNKLQVHHIQSWKNNIDLRISIENGISICYTHHRMFHRIYGNRDGVNSKNFEEFVKLHKEGYSNF